MSLGSTVKNASCVTGKCNVATQSGSCKPIYITHFDNKEKERGVWLMRATEAQIMLARSADMIPIRKQRILDTLQI